LGRKKKNGQNKFGAEAEERTYFIVVRRYPSVNRVFT